ncbi:MAG TPA: hypothetical protein DCF63_14925, partial [Planctomycetaceae bacterium]|nr:hypothetical protein [Planctomycetaceae bacterium]
CHNHKFDPFTQEDYYSLQAVFAALDRAARTYWSDPETGRRQVELAAKKRAAETRRDELIAVARKAAGPALADIERRLAATQVKNQVGNPTAEYGYHSGIANRQDAAKWVQVDLGKSVALASVVLRPCYDDYNNIGAGFGFPVRYRVELSDDPAFPPGPSTIVLAARDDADQRNPGVEPQRIDVAGPRGRYVRVTAVKLAPRSNDFIFALAELTQFDVDGNNATSRRPVAALDSIESGPRWGKANLVDGRSPAAPEKTPVRQLAADRTALLRQSLDAASFAALEAAERQVAEMAAEHAKLPPPSVVYAGTIHAGSGAFAGTGASGGKPRPIAILQRGNVTQRGREVSAGAIAAFPMLPGRFDLPADHAEGERRAALARWLVSPDNPLTWRSIVNRVWQYHFGTGIVDSANDFGRMGGLPSHPELLDWLAVTFRDEMQGSIKQLHRLIVTSATYRQSSIIQQSQGDSPDTSPRHSKAQQVDAQNRFLWKASRRKLDAEAFRDAVLAVSGQMDWTMDGPSFQDFVVVQPEHSPHYEYHLHDPTDPKTHRRSIYRFLVRSKPQPFMSCLDCADPSLRVDKRNESHSAQQALALLNNGLIVSMAQTMADQLIAASDQPTVQVQQMFRRGLQRPPSDSEQEMFVEYIRRHGLANACRAILSLNEFMFVD